MTVRTELDRFAAARPALLDHTELVVDAAQEDQILRQILESAVPAGDAASGAESAHRAVTLLPARSGHRPRRLGIAAAGAAAAAVAIGVLAGTGTLSGAPGKARGISIVTLAYRTAAATSGASQTDVLYSQVVYSGGTDAADASVQEWDFGISTREKSFSAQGGLTYDSSAVVSDGLRDRRFVDYADRNWSQDSIPVSQYGAGTSIASQVKSMLGTPGQTVTQVEVGGTRMFEVTWQWQAPAANAAGGPFPIPMFTSSNYLPAMTYNGAATTRIWIDAATYLPVRAVMSLPGGQVLASQAFSWLPPGPASLTELTPATVPAGFSEVAEPAH